MGVLVLRKSGGKRTGGSIALRILATHIQATSAIKSFMISGTPIYKRIMSWADVLSPVIISQGPAQCALHPTFTGVFYATMMAPFLICACAMCMLVIAMFVRTREGHSRVAGAKLQWQESIQQRKPHAILLFVCQLAYMPIVSASLNVFHCSEPIEGVKYLVVDMRMACEGGTYTALVTSAACILLIGCLGFPILICVVLARADPVLLNDPTFYATWGFLYDGYRQDPNSHKSTHRLQRIFTSSISWLPWWESTVLLRKACIVLLSRLVDNPMLQVALLCLVIFIALLAHQAFRPYSSNLFQRAEGASLLCIAVTSLLCIAGSQMSADSASSAAVTTVMVATNLVTIVFLLTVLFLKRRKKSLIMSRTEDSRPAAGILTQSLSAAVNAAIQPTKILRVTDHIVLQADNTRSIMENPAFRPQRLTRKTSVAFEPRAAQEHATHSPAPVKQ